MWTLCGLCVWTMCGLKNSRVLDFFGRVDVVWTMCGLCVDFKNLRILCFLACGRYVDVVWTKCGRKGLEQLAKTNQCWNRVDTVWTMCGLKILTRFVFLACGRCVDYVWTMCGHWNYIIWWKKRFLQYFVLHMSRFWLSKVYVVSHNFCLVSFSSAWARGTPSVPDHSFFCFIAVLFSSFRWVMFEFLVQTGRWYLERPPPNVRENFHLKSVPGYGSPKFKHS